MTKDTQIHTTSSHRSFKHISFKDRQLIEFLFRKKSPVSRIARQLEFHRSSIYRELKRGHVFHLNSELRTFPTYSADRAQVASSLALSSRGPDLKIASNHALVLFLRSLICTSKMSPYTANQVAKHQHDDVPVCSRTLYHYIDRFNFLASPSDLIHDPRRSRRKPILKRLSRTILYYAHPYCASERGSNENANRPIRRFFPKGTDFSSSNCLKKIEPKDKLPFRLR